MTLLIVDTQVLEPVRHRKKKCQQNCQNCKAKAHQTDRQERNAKHVEQADHINREEMMGVEFAKCCEKRTWAGAFKNTLEF